MSALHDAVRAKNFDEAPQLLQIPAVDVNTKNSGGNTALHFATDKSIARLLIEAGAGVNSENDEGIHQFTVP